MNRTPGDASAAAQAPAARCSAALPSSIRAAIALGLEPSVGALTVPRGALTGVAVVLRGGRGSHH
ncbi:hypothetical protein AB0C52_34510 [Streptomyces sp. NPDC048717]|uniref:hypothetical protein n=1 Tax=Streptomyces sp. NPDC048717 TaxID=3154928 RepID=UPI00343D8380